MRRRWNSQAVEYCGCASLGGVPIVPLHRFLEFGEPVGIEGLLGVGEQRLPLDQRVPQLWIALERDAEDFLFVVHELILAQNAESAPFRNRYGAVVGGEVPAQDPEQRGLARAVGADEPVPFSRVELERYPGEQGPVAERFRDIGNGDNGGAI